LVDLFAPAFLVLWLSTSGVHPPLLTSEFDYDLPDALIAQYPVEPRDQSRLMVVRRSTGCIEHRVFADLPDLLESGDLLVRNNSRVIPARLIGLRESTGGQWEGLFLKAEADGTWEILASTRGHPSVGERVVVGQGLILTLKARGEDGRWRVRPDRNESPESLLEQHGVVPLPPYIRKGREGPGDRARYQTLYAQVPGAVAAPTAGLHFTEQVFARLSAQGIDWVDTTLHVGVGTFRPISAEHIEDHRLHAEWAELSTQAANTLIACRGRGNRVVAVGTTSTRILETATKTGNVEAFVGETDLYLKPGHTFRGVDALITNFHLPRSSLLVLVSAFAGIELIRAAYAEAIRERYRFYSYGDVMLMI
jgi:S-adenosylmethionine:tRNA ribosyltransferase-isomerase